MRIPSTSGITSVKSTSKSKTPRKHRARDPVTGLFQPTVLNSTSPPLSPNSKRRQASVARAAIRAKQGHVHERDFVVHGCGTVLRIPYMPNKSPPEPDERTNAQNPDLAHTQDSHPQDTFSAPEDVIQQQDTDMVVETYLNKPGEDSDLDRQADLQVIVDSLTRPGMNSRRAFKLKSASVWETIISGNDKFITAYLSAEARIYRRATEDPEALVCECIDLQQSKTVFCVSLKDMDHKVFNFCSGCSSLPVEMMRNGFFPATPLNPCNGFDIELLKFYLKMDVTAKSPVSALTGALIAGLQDRGYIFDQREPFLHQFRMLLPIFEKVQRLLELRVQQEIDNTIVEIPNTIPTPSLQPAEANEKLSPGKASFMLRQRCSACFGRNTWGGDPEIAPDVIVCADANYQHQHYSHIQQDPAILGKGDNYNWLTSCEINEAKSHVDACRSKGAVSKHSRRTPRVPAHILDECEKSYKASQEKDRDPDSSLYDSHGIMALVCRHDIPLFLADVKTPGEPRYYAIALLRKLAAELPQTATMGVMYDIGEQLERSIAKYNMIPELAPRLSFALALFHAFGHQMACQVIYSPRWRRGFGLSNGEGNERVWALCTDTIASERVMGPNRRKFLLSRKMEHIAKLKNDSHDGFRTRMQNRIDRTCKDGVAVIHRIPPLNGTAWTRDRLLQQAEQKKKDHLDAKEATNTQITNNVRLLLDASRNAAGMSKALEEVSEDLMRYDYALTVLGSGEVEGLRTVAAAIIDVHKRTSRKLDTLSQNLGLSTVKLPATDHLSESDQCFLRHLVHLQTIRQVLWANLQSYQDEAHPLTEASSRGGRMRRLGTTKLATSTHALKSKAKQVAQTVGKYNSVVGQLDQIERPSFVPAAMIPSRLAVQDLLHLTPDDSLWNEVFGDVQWFSSYTDPTQRKEIPAYARSRPIRDGILAALSLERAEEEQKRLEVEKINCINDWILSVVQTWVCRSHHRDSAFQHRINLALQQTIRRRPRLKDFDIYDRSALFQTTFSSLLLFLKHQHPLSLVNTMNASATEEAAVLEVPQTTEITTRSPLFKMNDDDFEGLLRDGEQNPAQEDLQDLDDDDFDPEAAQRAVGSLNQRLTSLALEGTLQSSDDIGILPPARYLISQIDGQSSREPIVPYAQDRLPPVGILLDALDDPAKVTSLGSVDRLMGIARSAAVSVPSVRVPVGHDNRYQNHRCLSVDILKSLDEGRHLHPDVVYAATLLIQADLQSGPLGAQALGVVAREFVVVATNWIGIQSPRLVHALQESRVSLSSPADPWIAPLLLPGSSRQWLLLVVRFDLRQCTVSSGCPLPMAAIETCRHVLLLLGSAYQAIWELRFEQNLTWNDMTSYRQRTPAESALWCLADLQHALLSLPLPTAGFDLALFRNRIRQLITTLPDCPQQHALPSSLSPSQLSRLRSSIRSILPTQHMPARMELQNSSVL